MVELLDPVNVIALGDLYNTVIKQWVGPIVLAGIAVFAIIFLKDRAWMKLISFVGIAAVVALLVYGGDFLFNGQGTGLTGVANNIAGEVAP